MVSLLLPQAATRPFEPVRGWIESRGFDLIFFILSPVVGLLVIGGTLHTPLGPAVAVGAAYLIGLPHYLSSFSFFLGDENLAYYRTRFLLYFVGPLLIFASVLALGLLAIAYIVHAVIFVWNVYHVAAQSSGILSLYRRLNGGHHTERIWAHLTILFVSATMAFWYIDRFPPLHFLISQLHPDAPIWLRYACLAAAGIFGAGYVRCILRRSSPVCFAEKSFLATSLLLFTPYLWVQDSNLATLGMLMGHFIQYLAIVWLLNRRKFVPASGSSRQQWLGRVSASLPLLMGVMICAGLFFYALDKGSRMLEISAWYAVLWNSLALIHFYIDGLVWAFKNPFVRRTVGPFITPDSYQVRPRGA